MSLNQVKLRRVQSLPGALQPDTIYLVQSGANRFDMVATDNASPVNAYAGNRGLKGDKGDKGDRGPKGLNFEPDSTGLFAGRAAYDGEDGGYAYLSTDGDGDALDTAVLFWKNSSSSGDWSEPTPFGGVSNYDDLLNKPPLGTAAAKDTDFFATGSQGARADTAVQPDELVAAVEDAIAPVEAALSQLPVAFKAWLGSDVAIDASVGSVLGTVVYDQVTFNYGGAYDPLTGKFRPPPGIYYFTATIMAGTGTTAGARITARLFSSAINEGIVAGYFVKNSVSTISETLLMSGVFEADGETDFYVTCQMYSPASGPLKGGEQRYSTFSAVRIFGDALMAWGGA